MRLACRAFKYSGPRHRNAARIPVIAGWINNAPILMIAKLRQPSHAPLSAESSDGGMIRYSLRVFGHRYLSTTNVTISQMTYSDTFRTYHAICGDPRVARNHASFVSRTNTPAVSIALIGVSDLVESCGSDLGRSSCGAIIPCSE